MSSPPTGNRPGPLLWMGLLLVLALALGLRLFQISTNSLWGDEASSAYVAAQPLRDILSHLERGVHPPLYFVVLHFWILLAGASEFSLRFVSLFFGVIAAAGTFALGRRILGPAVGLGAALLLAINPFQIWYSQEARMYTMLTVLGLLASILFVKLVQRWSWRLFWSYVLMATLALFTHYYGAFFLAFHNLYGLVSLGWQRHHLRGWLGSQALTFLLFAPWLVLSFAALPTAHQELPPSEMNPLVEFWQDSLVGVTLDGPVASGASLAVTPLFLWGLGVLYRRRTLSVGGLFFATLAALPFLVSPFRAVEPRYLVVASPGYVLILAAALFGSQRLLPLGLLLSLALMAISSLALQNLYFNPAYGKGGYRELTQEIAALAQPGDVVVVNGPSQLYQYEYYRPTRITEVYIPSRRPMDTDASLAQLEELARHYSGLWFLKSVWLDSDTEMIVAKWLDDNAYPVSFHGVFGQQGSDEWLAYYRPPPQPAPPWQERGVAFGDQITLLSYSMEDEAPSGGSLAVALRWRAEQSLSTDYKVFLHLRDDQSNLWGQRDDLLSNDVKPISRWAPGEAVIDRQGLRIPPGAPPGRYELYLGVYPASGGPPLTPEGVTGAPEVKLGSVTVTLPAEPPPPQALRPVHRTELTLEPNLKLLGYDLPPQVSPGQPTPLRLYWQAQSRPTQDYQLALELQDGRGNASSQRFPLSSYPSSQWRPGEVMVGIYPLLPGPRLESGEGTLLLQLDGLQGPPENGEARLTLPTRIPIRARAHSFGLPEPQHRMEAELGGLARLLGYDLDRVGAFKLTLYWQAMAETTTNYKVFTHLVDAQGRLVTQHDASPDRGEAPTASWLPGEVITDGHDLILPPGLAPGDYRLVVGLYEPISGNRLQTPDGQDALWLNEAVTTP